MQRRTVIRNLLSLVSFRNARLRAQTQAFPGQHASDFARLAAAVLPESLEATEIQAVTRQFARWVQEYRAGAEMQTGYGATRVRYKAESPAGRYLEQLRQLSSGALAETSVSLQRKKIAEALQAANVRDLPTLPDGIHIAADLMSFYFQSSAANDLAYNSAIGKDQCRTLKNSGSMPSPLRQDATHAAL